MEKFEIEDIIAATECSYGNVEKPVELHLVDQLEMMFDIDFSDSYNSDNPRLIHAEMGFKTEVAEYVDMWKKHMFYDKDIDHVNAVEELFDCMWYVAIAESATSKTFYGARDILTKLAAAHGKTFDEMINIGGGKLKARYPNGFTNKDAEDRDLAAERSALEG